MAQTDSVLPKISNRNSKQISAESMRELQLSEDILSEAYRLQQLRLVVLKVLITPWLIKRQPHGICTRTSKLTRTNVP